MPRRSSTGQAAPVVPAVGALISKRHAKFLPTDPRDVRIEKGLGIVLNIADELFARGQKTFVEKSDLLQVGFLEMIQSVDRPSTGFPLDKCIYRNAKTQMIRFIKKHQQEWRYRERGNQKAIRDTEAGNHAADVDGGQWDDAEVTGGVTGDLNPDIADAAPARIALSVRNHDFPNSDAFVYRGWLRGSVDVILEAIDLGREGRRRFIYAFKEPEEPEFYVRPVLESLSDRRRPIPDPHPAYPWEASWKPPGTTWVISKEAGVKEVKIHARKGATGAARILQAWGQTIGPIRTGSTIGLPDYESKHRARRSAHGALWAKIRNGTACKWIAPRIVINYF